MSAAISTRKTGLPLVVCATWCAALVIAVLLAGTYLDFRQPFFGYGLGGAFLLCMASKLTRRRLAILAVIGILLALWVAWGRYQDAATLLVQVMGAFGMASLLLMSCIVTCNGRKAEPTLSHALLAAVVLAFLVLGAKYSLNMASLLQPKTLDIYAFVFDGNFGQPSFILGRLLNANPWMFPLVKISYEGILLAMAALYAGFMGRRSRPVWEIIEVLFASAMIGYLFFSVFPVCGPRYAFGRDFPAMTFPHDFFQRLALEKVAIPLAFPRNGVPSLHMTWALLIWLNTRGLPRWARLAALALVLATAFDTLATGEHYLFDLVVALPFTLWMQAWMARTADIRERRRWLPAACGCALFLAWLAVGRFGLSLLVDNRVLAWLLVAASSILSLAWAMRLPPMIPEMQHAPSSSLEPVDAASVPACVATGHSPE